MFRPLCYTRAMRILGITLIALAALANSLKAQQPAASIDLPQGARTVFQAKGDGVQIYACTESTAGKKWLLKGPEAKLLNASGNVIGTHFAGPTWKLNLGGQVQGELVGSKPSPEQGAIPWLLLRTKTGKASGSLASVAYIRRTETHGGAAPASGCQRSQDAGKTAQIPYTATYTFYTGK